MKIFVNATAADVGGLKSIVEHFLAHISQNGYGNVYYVFVSNDQFDTYSNETIKLIKVNSKKWIKRIVWDFSGMKHWAIKNNIKPDQIVSLQNTPVNYKKIDQIIYLHTPLPFVNYQWNIFKRTERKLWFYKNIYPFFIKLFWNEKCKIVVQANWLKTRVTHMLKIDKSKVFVIKPDFSLKEELESRNGKLEYKNKKLEEEIFMFYPAIDYLYKNHLTIFKALKLIKKNNPQLYNKLKFVITVNKNTETYQYARELGIESAVEFIGRVPFPQIIREYKRCKFVLFPSYIETAGLPLLEAAYFNKLIICADELYSKELIGDYEGINFIPAFDVNEWKNMIEYFAEVDIEPFKYEIQSINSSWEEFMLLIKKGDKIEN
ncbi:glycosyltransferase [Cytobacillus firmus]|uniref:glycosyltransferase n=1 Tax=Cytobacillus firmus TaxID=1399 RepID=UPI00202EE503|nr:glycosyltransferase [Cytobacillus firmus]URT70589.1 glycosyltransferase [Cytobacillus firmus]